MNIFGLQYTTTLSVHFPRDLEDILVKTEKSVIKEEMNKGLRQRTSNIFRFGQTILLLANTLTLTLVCWCVTAPGQALS